MINRNVILRHRIAWPFSFLPRLRGVGLAALGPMARGHRRTAKRWRGGRSDAPLRLARNCSLGTSPVNGGGKASAMELSSIAFTSLPAAWPLRSGYMHESRLEIML